MSKAAISLPAIERTTLNERAYAEIKRALLSGRLEPGTTLTLRQLAAELGTSMMPVREAVTRLSAENALAVAPNRGIVVPPLDEDEAADIWQLRIRLEGEACARAALAAGADDVAHMRALAADVQRAAAARDLHAVLECNSDFQFAMYQAAGSKTLLQLIEILRMRSVPYCTRALRYMLAERPAYYAQSWRNHDAMVDAIGRGDAPGARQAKQSDLREFRDFVRSVEKQAV